MDDCRLPLDVLRLVIQYLDPPELLRLSLTCRKLMLACRQCDAACFRVFCHAFSLRPDFIVFDKELDEVSWTLPCCGVAVPHEDLLQVKGTLRRKARHIRLTTIPDAPRCRACGHAFRHYDQVLQAAHKRLLAAGRARGGAEQQSSSSWIDVILRLRGVSASSIAPPMYHVFKRGAHSSRVLILTMSVGMSLSCAYMLFCAWLTGNHRHPATLASLLAFTCSCVCGMGSTILQEMHKVPTLSEGQRERLLILHQRTMRVFEVGIRVSVAAFGLSLATLTCSDSGSGEARWWMRVASLVTAVGFCSPSGYLLLALALPFSVALSYMPPISGTARQLQNLLLSSKFW